MTARVTKESAQHKSCIVGVYGIALSSFSFRLKPRTVRTSCSAPDSAPETRRCAYSSNYKHCARLIRLTSVYSRRPARGSAPFSVEARKLNTGNALHIRAITHSCSTTAVPDCTGHTGHRPPPSIPRRSGRWPSGSCACFFPSLTLFRNLSRAPDLLPPPGHSTAAPPLASLCPFKKKKGSHTRSSDAPEATTTTHVSGQATLSAYCPTGSPPYCAAVPVASQAHLAHLCVCIPMYMYTSLRHARTHGNTIRGVGYP